MKIIETEKVQLAPSQLKSILGKIDGRLHRIWSVMLWLMLVPGFAAAGLMIFGLARAILLDGGSE